MSTLLQSSLHQAATSTFEQVIFLLPDAPPQAHQLDARVQAVASISFTGSVDGMLEIWVCGGVLPILATNMLGESEPPEEAMQRDALGEIANIICGMMLPQIAPEQVFEQTSPQVDDGSEYSLQYAPKPDARVQLGVEDGRADVLLYLFDAGTLNGAAA